MKVIDLINVEHEVKIGDKCVDIEPNVKDDSLFVLDGVPIGFYIKDIGKYSNKAAELAALANSELRSSRVPKSTMGRSKGLLDNDGTSVMQYSTILGGCPPRPHMRRPYPTMSSVHSVESAQKFVKAMILLANESEQIIKSITPNVYDAQLEIFDKLVPDKWRFSKLFTSSISNYNIAANYHRDGANIQGCVNVIIAKRENARGGNTTVPDYGATVDSCDSSMLVYPAWRNVHGVTPIVPTKPGGYRNSLVSTH